MPDTHGIVVAGGLLASTSDLGSDSAHSQMCRCWFPPLLLCFHPVCLFGQKYKNFSKYSNCVVQNTSPKEYSKKKIVLRSNMFWQNFPLEIWNVCQPIRGFMKHRGRAVSRYMPLIFGHILHLRSCFKAGRINEYFSVLSVAALQVLSQY